jgi:hypothetical protein
MAAGSPARPGIGLWLLILIVTIIADVAEGS